jgi:hypothetical protein
MELLAKEILKRIGTDVVDGDAAAGVAVRAVAVDGERVLVPPLLLVRLQLSKILQLQDPAQGCQMVYISNQKSQFG